MGFIRAGFRVSTEEQDVMHAKKEIDDFAQLHNQKFTVFYYEKFTGTSFNRPELNRLFADTQQGDSILIESVDCISP